MRATLPTLVGTALLGAASLSAAADIDVMTQNQYLGTDLEPVLSAATADPFDPTAFNLAVVTALQRIAASKPAERARALAANIAQRNPDVVGLQEAYQFVCMPLGPQAPGQNCDHPALKAAFTDQLANTVAALRGRYMLAGKVTEMKLQAPQGIPFTTTTDGSSYGLLTLADRDAILVKTGLPAQPVNLAALTGCRASDQGCNYNNGGYGPPTLTLPGGLGTIAIERGYLAVDVTVRGRDYRVFNTHLEQRLLSPSQPQTRLLQVMQAYELLGTTWAPMPSPRHVIILGDFNSDPADLPIVFPGPTTYPTPYQVLALGGFTDTWLMRPQETIGASCCQAADLLNFRSELYERIDLIFSLTPPRRVVDMKLIGATMGDKTRPSGHGGLWPSDHASVAARLFFD